jgi:uncharacterized protein YprB with RNaseH-like and TPR domain
MAGYYYFDTETTGLDPLTKKIITIQWQQLSELAGEPIGNLNILKEWESSEEEILKTFLPNLKFQNPFNFIMIGKNLLFDFAFLSHRAKKYGLGELDLQYFCNRVSLDLKHLLVMINNGNFRGYDKVLDKIGSLTKIDVPVLYGEGRYSEIIKYVQDEAEVFIKAYQILKKEMPKLRELF